MRSVDIAKFVAALWVVALHAQPLVGFSKFLVIDTLGQLAVPFFFIASAFFFFRKPVDSGRVRHYLHRMGLLYVFWFVVTLPITVLHAFIEPQEPFTQRLFCFVRGLLFDSSFHGSWFLMALMQAVPLCWLLSRRLSDRWLLVLSLAVFAFTEAMSPHYASLFAPFSDHFQHVRTVSWESFLAYAVTGGWTKAFVYVVLGRMLAHASVFDIKRSSSFWVEWPLLFLLIAAVVEAYILYPMPESQRVQLFFVAAPLITLLLFLMLMRHEVRWQLPYSRIRQWSTLFYFSHFIYVFVLVVVNKHLLPIAPGVKYALVLLLCALTSELILRLSSRPRWAWLRWAY